MDVILLDRHIDSSALMLNQMAHPGLVNDQVIDLMKLIRLIIFAKDLSFSQGKFITNDGSEQDKHPRKHTGGTLVKIWSRTSQNINEAATYGYLICHHCSEKNPIIVTGLDCFGEFIRHRRAEMPAYFSPPHFYFGSVKCFDLNEDTFLNYRRHVRTLRESATP